MIINCAILSLYEISPLAKVGHRSPFFRRHVVVLLLCGWDVAAPQGRRRPSGARESQLLGGVVVTKIFSKIHLNVTTTTLACYIMRRARNPVIRAIGVSHTACKDEFRQNIRSHS